MSQPASPSPDDDLHPLLKTNARYYFVKQVADILGVSERTVYSRIEEGKWKAVRPPDTKKGWKLPRSEVLRLVSAMESSGR